MSYYIPPSTYAADDMNKYPSIAAPSQMEQTDDDHTWSFEVHDDTTRQSHQRSTHTTRIKHSKKGHLERRDAHGSKSPRQTSLANVDETGRQRGSKSSRSKTTAGDEPSDTGPDDVADTGEPTDEGTETGDVPLGKQYSSSGQQADGEDLPGFVAWYMPGQRELWN